MSTKTFGKDLGLMHELVVTGRKAGFTEEDWAALAHSQKLAREVLGFLRQNKGLGDGKKFKLPVRWDINCTAGHISDLVRWVKEHERISCEREFDQMVEAQLALMGKVPAPLTRRSVQLVTLNVEELGIEKEPLKFSGLVSDALSLRAWSLTNLEGQILKPCSLVTALSLPLEIGCGLKRADKVWIPLSHPKPDKVGVMSLMRSGDGQEIILEGRDDAGDVPWNADGMDIVFEICKE